VRKNNFKCRKQRHAATVDKLSTVLGEHKGGFRIKERFSILVPLVGTILVQFHLLGFFRQFRHSEIPYLKRRHVT